MTIYEEARLGLPVSVPIIDAHSHLQSYYLHQWYVSPDSVSPEAYIDCLDRLGFDCVVTGPHDLVLGCMESSNAYAAEISELLDGRVYGYIVISPVAGMKAVKEQIRLYQDNPRFVGFGFLPGYNGQLDEPAYQYAIKVADELRAPVEVHTWYDNPPLREVARLAEENPGAKVICAHQGGGTAELSDRLGAMMREIPNLYVDNVGSLENTYGMEEMVEVFGEDRIVFGTDMVSLDPRFDFGRLALAPLSDDTKRKIFADNFQRLLWGSYMGKINLNGKLTAECSTNS